LLKPTSQLLSFVSLPHDFSADATCPNWEAFLASVFGGEGGKQCIAALQEFCGLVLTSDTSFQKMLVLIGPPRSGKSTILRVLQSMVGKGNFASTTLAGLAKDFGLYPLLNKPLAIIGDASLSGKVDGNAALEILKNITGEDPVPVNRKYHDPFDAVLSTRIAMALNEPPAFSDSSNALSPRMILLPFTKSFAGKEDFGLTDRLVSEMPGIVLWSLRGLQRLRANGRFTATPSNAGVLAEFEEVTSPVHAFVRTCCVVGDGEGNAPTVKCQRLYAEYRNWCERTGHKAASINSLGVKLRAVCPGITRERESGGSRDWYYTGIALADASGDAMKE
jgi:putative DNA primase/helicase